MDIDYFAATPNGGVATGDPAHLGRSVVGGIHLLAGWVLQFHDVRIDGRQVWPEVDDFVGGGVAVGELGDYRVWNKCDNFVGGAVSSWFRCRGFIRRKYLVNFKIR
jgi:hypothetical protein